MERERPHRTTDRAPRGAHAHAQRRRILRRPRRRFVGRAPSTRRGAILRYDDAGDQRHDARLPDPRVQGRAQLLADRDDRRADAVLGRRAPGALAHGRRRVAKDPRQGARRRVPRGPGARRPLPAAHRRRRPRVRSRHRMAARDGGPLPLHADGRSGPGHRGREGRHGVGPTDGPPGLRRRWIRQDRGRDPRGLQGGPGRQAGRRAGADDAVGEPALRHVQ